MKLLASHELKEPKHLGETVDAALKQGAKLIIVGGGDGSFRTVIGRIAAHDAVLGVLPLGTVNDFARNLGIEATVEAACDVIANGRVECIDVGQCNDDHFVITASIGFSARTQQALSPKLKKAFGPFGYVAASLIAFRKLRKLRVTIRHADSQTKPQTLDILQAGVVNGHAWMGGKFEIPGKHLESGRLAFYAVPNQSLWQLLRMARSLANGDFWHTSGLETFFADDVTLETPFPQPIVIDGDLCGKTPAQMRILRGALSVCVPADYNPANPAPEK